MKHRRLLGAMALGLSVFATSACVSNGAARVEPLRAGGLFGDSDSSKVAAGCDVEADRPRRIWGGKANGNRPGSINLDCFRFPDHRPDSNPSSLAYVRASPGGNPAGERVTVRNRLAALLMAQSDAICTSEKGLMFKRQAEVGGWLSIATTGMAATSSIVTGDLAKSILSGGAAFTSASRDHINTYAFYNQMMPTMTKAMDDARATKAMAIATRLKEPADQYTVDDMIREVNQYHQLCSFTTAMQTVLDAVNNKQRYEKALKADQIQSAIRTLQDLRGTTTDKAAQQKIDDETTALRGRLVAAIADTEKPE